MWPIIPRPLHAVLDYFYGASALMAPKLFFFDGDDKARKTTTLIGVAALISSLTTKYEGGAIKLLPFNLHLQLDTGAALLAAASPWIFGFARNARARNTVIALALLEAGVVALSKPDPQ